MLRRSRIALAAAALSITTFAIAAHAKLVTVDKGEAKIKGEAGLIKFDGTLKEITAKEDDDKITFRGNLSQHLDMGLRDGHTREAFNICDPKTKKDANDKDCKDTFVTLSIPKSKLKMPEDKKKAEGKVLAQLKVGDWKQIDVEVAYVVSRTGSDYHVKSAKFDFPYTTIGVPQIVQMGVAVKPILPVEIKGIKLREK